MPQVLHGSQNENYIDRSDEELIDMIRHNSDEGAVDYLINKYTGMVKKESRALYLIGGEREDLIQEGMIGLYKAVRDYSADKGTSFFTFANICVRRQMLSAVNMSNRKKHQPLNSAVSFYSGGDGEDVMLIDTLEADELSKPESLMMYRYNIDDMNKKIEGRLSVYEKKVLAEYLTGDSYDAIAARLGKPEKSIDNAIQRIRKKLDQ